MRMVLEMRKYIYIYYIYLFNRFIFLYCLKIKRLVDLLKKTGEDTKFRAALSNALSAAANDVLMKKVSKKKNYNKLNRKPVSD